MDEWSHRQFIHYGKSWKTHPKVFLKIQFYGSDQFLENASKYHPKFDRYFYLLNSLFWFSFPKFWNRRWMSFPEIGLAHAPQIWHLKVNVNLSKIDSVGPFEIVPGKSIQFCFSKFQFSWSWTRLTNGKLIQVSLNSLNIFYLLNSLSWMSFPEIGHDLISNKLE